MSISTPKEQDSSLDPSTINEELSGRSLDKDKASIKVSEPRSSTHSLSTKADDAASDPIAASNHNTIPVTQAAAAGKRKRGGPRKEEQEANNAPIFSRKLPKSLNNNSRILNVISSMFRQHAKLFSQEALLLEKMAQYPLQPHLWFDTVTEMDKGESNFETLDDRIFRDNVYKLALNSCRDMEEIRVEMDALQQWMECKMQENFDDSDGSSSEEEIFNLRNQFSPTDNLNATLDVYTNDGDDSLSKDSLDMTDKKNQPQMYHSRDRDELDSDDSSSGYF